VISGFRREIDENCARLAYYAASRGNFLPTFREKILIPSSGVKNPKRMGPIGCTEMLVTKYLDSLHNNLEERNYQIHSNGNQGQFLSGNFCVTRR
jgi:hypothetical protein